MKNPLGLCLAFAIAIMFILYTINFYLYIDLKKQSKGDFQNLNSKYEELQKDSVRKDELLSVMGEKLEIFQRNIMNLENSKGGKVRKVIVKKKVETHDLPSINVPNLRQEDEIWVNRPSHNDYLILFAISTLARKDNQGNPLYYLKDACESLLRQINIYYSTFRNTPHHLKVYVQNSDPTVPHVVFNELKNDPKYKEHFIFKTISKRFDDPHTDVPGHDYTHPKNIIPGHRARQQSCDIISLHNNVMYDLNYDYFVFVEDDFLACDNAVVEMVRSIAILETKHMGFCGLRMSYGMNGILLPRDLGHHYVTYLQRNLKELPIDDLFHRFTKSKDGTSADLSIMCAPNHRPLFNYRNIMWEHIGHVSTFSERNKEGFRSSFPRCKATSVEITVQCLGNPEMLQPC